MLSSAKIGISSWRYYQREVATDPSEYFLARGEAPGRWWGRGVCELGLGRDGVVAERQLEALLARGLLVEHLAGRGRAALPVGYLARHADYGWASTIDGAQGATADIGILLARTGLDREHLYVGMTRGRHANHVHVTSERADDDVHRPRPLGSPSTVDDVVRVLETATTRVGAQQAAHTLLDQARERAQPLGLGRHTSVATRGLDSEREHGPWVASKERSRNWSRRPELPSPSSGRSIGR